MTDGRAMVRNSALNFVGLVIPLGLAVVAIPPLVHGFGAERFGILTLGWAAIGYFNLFELGLSRALTQAVASRLGTSEQRGIASLVWTTLGLLTVLGIVAGIVLAALTPAIVERGLNISDGLLGEAQLSFYILSLALPMVLLSAGFRGLLEAHLDFGTVNALRLPLAAFTFVGPWISLGFSRSLVPAMVILVAGRVAGCVAHLILCYRRYPYLRGPIRMERADVGPLLRFGSWSTITNAVSPLMMYMDRFLIGSALSLAAVTHYVTSYEVASKLMIIPGSVLAAVFPAIAATFAADVTRMARLYGRAQRLVLLIMYPLVLPVVVFAQEGLRSWMGPALPPESAVVLRWLALGIFINAMAHAPSTALQGSGRPDLVAKVHLAELPVYVAALAWLFPAFGIVGVAIAWTLRVTVDTLALLLVARGTLKLRLADSPTTLGIVVLMLASLAVGAAIPETLSRVIYVFLVPPFVAWMAWRHLITTSEREALGGWIRGTREMRDPEVA